MPKMDHIVSADSSEFQTATSPASQSLNADQTNQNAHYSHQNPAVPTASTTDSANGDSMIAAGDISGPNNCLPRPHDQFLFLKSS
jgi:hypothetical protein